MTTVPPTPPAPPKAPKCPNPDCKIELVLINGELPDKCEKCGFILEGWENFFKQWFKTAMKLHEEENKPAPTVVPPKKRGILSGLGRRK